MDIGFALDRVGVALGKIGVIVGAGALAVGRCRAVGRRVAPQLERGPYLADGRWAAAVRDAGLYVDRGVPLTVPVGLGRRLAVAAVLSTGSVSVSVAAPEAAAGGGTAVTVGPVPSGSVPNRIRPATTSPTTPAAVAEASRARLGIII
ncbi:MAG TPA: hypothetical protein VE476_13845 [Propionibacteriaceae bacterium]|nr:hypothetical protein [Propionibacteriaceae bacterium]